MTTAVFHHISRQIDKASFDQTSDLARRIEDPRTPNLTKIERIELGKRIAARLQSFAAEARTP